MNKLLSMVLTLILVINTIVTWRWYRTYLHYAYQPKAQHFRLKSAIDNRRVMANLYNLTIEDVKRIPQCEIISINPLVVQANFRSVKHMRKSIPSYLKCVYLEGEVQR